MSILMDEFMNRWSRRHLWDNYSSACRPKLFVYLVSMFLELPFSSTCTTEKRRHQGSPLQTSASKGINGGRNLDKNFFSFMGLCHLKFGTVVMWMAGYNSHSAFRNLLPSFSVPPSLKVYPSMGDSCCRLLKVSSAPTDCLSFYLFLSFKSFTFSWN